MSQEIYGAKEVAALLEMLRNEQRDVAEELLEDKELNCCGLNPHLVKRQGLTQSDIDAVEFQHERKNLLFEKMNKLDPEIDQTELQLCVLELQEIEFAMQRAWKWDEDADRHTWWFQAPHCRCPQMGNRDPIMPNRITRRDCPLHGWK